MKSPLICRKLIVKASSIHGYGVFADENISANEIIEECYALTIEHDKTGLIDFEFTAADDPSGNDSVLCLGYGSIYNHSEQSNASHEHFPEHSIMVFRAEEFIRKGEEIFIHYGDDWFSSRELKSQQPSLYYRLRTKLMSLRMIIRFAIATSAVFCFIGVIKIMSFFHIKIF